MPRRALQMQLMVIDKTNAAYQANKTKGNWIAVSIGKIVIYDWRIFASVDNQANITNGN